ncbi:hypothetical protein SAMN05443252_103347 [Bacillus sp. OV322]|nr:hypothetical protein SAMN05443252_103347 [Bacillus sp. OV322]
MLCIMQKRLHDLHPAGLSKLGAEARLIKKRKRLFRGTPISGASDSIKRQHRKHRNPPFIH